MLAGVDTTFLVELELLEHPRHNSSRRFLERHLEAGKKLALAPQVLVELVHVVTDPRRFERPLSVSAAAGRAALWWRAAEVEQVRPDAAAVDFFTRWMRELGLGRKRILDTMLAATYAAAGIRTLVTSNLRDFERLKAFDVVVPHRRK
jgi:predicted nucleic acid-binding protein